MRAGICNLAYLCDEVSLTLNDNVISSKPASAAREGVLIWQVSYQDGVLKAVGLKDGSAVCEYVFRTAGLARRVVVSQDVTEMRADGKSVLFHSNRVRGQAMAVHEKRDVTVQVTEAGCSGMLWLAVHSMNLDFLRYQPLLSQFWPCARGDSNLPANTKRWLLDRFVLDVVEDLSQLRDVSRLATRGARADPPDGLQGPFVGEDYRGGGEGDEGHHHRR